MSNIDHMFKEAGTSLGIFYPKHYVVASFPEPDALAEAERRVMSSGRAADEVIVLSPAQTLEFFESLRGSTGVGGDMMRGVSRALGDDATYADADVDRAKRGSGLIMIYAPLETDAHRVSEVLKPLAPLSMRWYESSGIQSLV